MQRRILPLNRKHVMEKYYHLHSSPLLHCPLFRNDVGRRFFLNHLALVLIDSRVKIYVYCLMDNHIHFLVSGEENDIIELFAEVKKIYGRFLVEEESHIPISLDRFSISMRVISGGEDFKIVTAYILRNGLVAGLGSPYSYKWCSVQLYYNPFVELFRGIGAWDYGMRKIRSVIKTRQPIPERLSFFDDMISPLCWCDYKKVEKVFGSSSEFFKYLGRWTAENEEESKLEATEKNAYTDSALVSKLKDYCSLQGVGSVDDLSAAELRNLIRMAHNRWGASKKQIERVIGISASMVQKYY